MAVFLAEKKDWTKDGRKYYFVEYYKDIYENTKQYKSRKYLTEKECKKENALFILKHENKVNNKVSFETLYAAYLKHLEKKVKGSTYYSLTKRANKHILPYFKNKSIEDININTINSWKDILVDNLATSYVNDLIIYLKSILKFATINLNIPTIYLRIELIKLENRPRKEHTFWTYNEWKKFDMVLDDLEYRLLFNILYFCGLRKGELLALTWGDIKDNEIHISKTVNYKTFKKGWEITTPKTRSSYRKVSIPNQTLELLDKYKETKTSYNDYSKDWFIFGDIRPLPLTTLTRKFDCFIGRANVKKIRIHDLRHSAVSLLVNKGNEEREIAKRMGHSVDMVRNVYSHLFPDKEDKLLDTLNSLE